LGKNRKNWLKCPLRGETDRTSCGLGLRKGTRKNALRKGGKDPVRPRKKRLITEESFLKKKEQNQSGEGA